MSIRWLLFPLLLPSILAAQSSVHLDVEYAKVGDISLRLDLYVPKAERTAPVIVWIHGGAWRGGSKSPMPLGWLVEQGYAVASVDYRLSTVAPFPAQMHDLKAAVRFLRARAGKYALDPDRIGVAGSSAGGHLAALLGVSGGVAELEGTVGQDLGQSSKVSAIVDYYGPTNFMTILAQSTPHGLSVRKPAFQLLLLGQPEEKPDLARLASPVFQVDAGDPPLLMLHGDQDPQVPINQSHELQGKYRALGLDSHLEVVYGGAHGGDGFFDEARQELVLKFLNRTLRP